MKSVKINLEKGVSHIGSSIGVAEVGADSEQKAESILDGYLDSNYPEMGRHESHYRENGKYYFAITG